MLSIHVCVPHYVRTRLAAILMRIIAENLRITPNRLGWNCGGVLEVCEVLTSAIYL